MNVTRNVGKSERLSDFETISVSIISEALYALAARVLARGVIQIHDGRMSDPVPPGMEVWHWELQRFISPRAGWVMVARFQRRPDANAYIRRWLEPYNATGAEPPRYRLKRLDPPVMMRADFAAPPAP
jgi:hypothetical protein